MKQHGTGSAQGLRWLERALDLRHAELRRVLILFACMFLVMTSFVLGKVARDALFLSRFPARWLPWADLSVALLMGAAAQTADKGGHTGAAGDYALDGVPRPFVRLVLPALDEGELAEAVRRLATRS